MAVSEIADLCAICQDMKEDPVELPCHHAFCAKCIRDLQERSGHGAWANKCPVCRQPIGGVELETESVAAEDVTLQFERYRFVNRANNGENENNAAGEVVAEVMPELVPDDDVLLEPFRYVTHSGNGLVRVDPSHADGMIMPVNNAEVAALLAIRAGNLVQGVNGRYYIYATNATLDFARYMIHNRAHH